MSPRSDKMLLEDLVNILPCYKQMADGWYVESCFEAGNSSAKSCVNCRILHRLQKRLLIPVAAEEEK